jgi:hypothetical protein
MRNMVDPNLTADSVQTNGADTVVSNSNSPDSHSNDSQREPVLRSTGRCPYHAMLEELDIWQGKEPNC